MSTGADTFAARTRQPARRVRAVLSAALPFSVLLALASTTLGGCGSSASGLPAQFDAAVETMQEAGGYTFNATIGSTGSNRADVTVSGDFQAPDRVEQSVARPGQTPVVMVLDGGSVHLRDPVTGTWTTHASSATGTVDLRRAFTAVSAAKEVRIDGDRATFTLEGDAGRVLAGDGASGRTTVSITLGPVGLSGLTYRATVDGRPVAVHIDYTAVGAAPPVTIPV